MSKHQGKGVKHALKGFLSGARKMVRPREDEALFAGRSSSESRWSQLLRHVEAEGLNQQRREVSEVRHIFNFVTNGFYILRLV
jgi:hypothetical protein